MRGFSVVSVKSVLYIDVVSTAMALSRDGSSSSRLLRMPEIARRLDVSLSHAYAMAARGELPHQRFGRSVRVDAAVFEAWLEERES